MYDQTYTPLYPMPRQHGVRVRDLQERTYYTRNGHQHAIRQLTRQGYDYFLVTHRTKRKTVLVFGKHPRVARKHLTVH